MIDDGQFLIKSFHSPFKLDRSRNGGCIMLYVRGDIPAKLVSILINIISRSFLPNTRILYFLVILMHVLMMRLYRHFANLTLWIVLFNNLHALEIPRTLASLI